MSLTNKDIATNISVVNNIDNSHILECHAAAQKFLDSGLPATLERRQARQNEKIKQQLRFFEDVIFADVTIDKENLVPLSVRSTSRKMVHASRVSDHKKLDPRF
uniref:Uncharacterized protein n=1 Tax=Eucampia antarctica TaxID=49252 RepID=A0A7S2VZ35_9STRA